MLQDVIGNVVWTGCFFSFVQSLSMYCFVFFSLIQVFFLFGIHFRRYHSCLMFIIYLICFFFGIYFYLLDLNVCPYLDVVFPFGLLFFLYFSFLYFLLFKFFSLRFSFLFYFFLLVFISFFNSATF